MNRIERRVRNIINPYSTAFAVWWCHSARYLPLVRLVTGMRAAKRPSWPPQAVARGGSPLDASFSMQSRRAAVDALLAGWTPKGRDDADRGDVSG
jgi:hypothetical protein